MRNFLRTITMAFAAIALLTGVEAKAQTGRWEWHLVKDASEIGDGDEIIIADIHDGFVVVPNVYYITLMSTSIHSTYGFYGDINGTDGKQSLWFNNAKPESYVAVLTAQQAENGYYVQNNGKTTMTLKVEAVEGSDNEFYLKNQDGNYLRLSSTSKVTTGAKTATYNKFKFVDFANSKLNNGNNVVVQGTFNNQPYNICYTTSTNTKEIVTCYFSPLTVSATNAKKNSVVFKKVYFPPARPEVSIHTDCRVFGGTEVTAESEGATSYKVISYSIDGKPVSETEFSTPELPRFTIDELHRRFEVIPYAADGAKGETADLFYNLYTEQFATEQQEIFQLVTDASEISDGDQIVLAGITHYNKGAETNVTEDGYYLAVLTTKEHFTESTATMPVALGSNEFYPGRYFSFPPRSSTFVLSDLPSLSNDYIVLTVEAVDARDMDKGFRLKYNQYGKEIYFYISEAAHFLPCVYISDAKPSIFQFTRQDGKLAISKYGQTDHWVYYSNSSNNKDFRYDLPGGHEPVKIFKKTTGLNNKIVKYDPEYNFSLSYTPSANAGSARAATFATESALTKLDVVDNEHRYAGNNTPNLDGDFILTLKGDNINIDLTADKNDPTNQQYLVDNFHTGLDVDGCNDDHDSYLYVGNLTVDELLKKVSKELEINDIRIIDKTHPDAVDLSTTPNRYHDIIVNHPNPVVTVNFKPFYNINLSVQSKGDNKPTAVENVAVDTDANLPAVYYNLQGVLIDAAGLQPGNVYIEQRGNTARKVVIR
ncbi:MAG: hypothetical protein J1E63_05400 [Muribaculaceae bacterium]|nr:hypothetical protein [Muribaculaceae bacterium]